MGEGIKECDYCKRKVEVPELEKLNLYFCDLKCSQEYYKKNEHN